MMLEPRVMSGAPLAKSRLANVVSRVLEYSHPGMPPGGSILALDQGPWGWRALVVDAEGVVRSRGYAELTQHYPQPGWVEHDPEEIWTTMGEAARQAMASAGVTGAEIAAHGITNQRETAIVWERASGAPIHRAIVWQGRRTAALCA